MTQTSQSKKQPPNRSLLRKQVSRLVAIQAWYARHYSETELAETVSGWVDELIEANSAAEAAGDSELLANVPPERALLHTLLESALEHENATDELIETSMGERWKVERTGPLLMAILHIASAELHARPEKKEAVIIHEYVTLASEFYDESEVGFVNGILAKMTTRIRHG